MDYETFHSAGGNQKYAWPCICSGDGSLQILWVVLALASGNLLTCMPWWSNQLNIWEESSDCLWSSLWSSTLSGILPCKLLLPWPPQIPSSISISTGIYMVFPSLSYDLETLQEVSQATVVLTLLLSIFIGYYLSLPGEQYFESYCFIYFAWFL